jgi:hypothetical protein
MSDSLTPFHLHAEELGTFLRDDRAREAELSRNDNDTDGPSENVD